MTHSVYTLTRCLPATQMADGLSQLTAFLFQAPYAFLQTFHQPGYSVFDIFDHQQRLLVRVALHPSEPRQSEALTSSPVSQTGLTPEAVALVQALNRLWATAST